MGFGMKTGRVGNALFKIHWYQNRVEGQQRFGVTRNWFGKGKIVGVWGGGMNGPNNLPKVIINQSAHAPSPARLRAGVEGLLDSYFNAANEVNDAKANFEKARQDFFGTKFKKGKAALIAAGISAVATAVFPFIGAIGFSLSTPLAAAFAIAAVEYFTVAMGIQYFIFRGGAIKKALREAEQKENEYKQKTQTYESLKNDVLKLYQDEAQREALAIELNSIWISGEKAKQNRCHHIYQLFTAEQQAVLLNLIENYQTIAAAEKKIEEGEPLEESLNQQLINRLDQVKKTAPQSGVAHHLQRIVTKIEGTPRGAEAAPSEELGKKLVEIGMILNREYTEVTEENLNRAQQDVLDLRASQRLVGLPADVKEQIKARLSRLNTVIEKHRKELKAKILAGIHAKYVIENPIGRGGMGIVSRGKNTSTNANVAIKYMFMSGLVEEAEIFGKGDVAKKKTYVMSQLYRFYTEYTLGERLHHDCICRPLDTNIFSIESIDVRRLTRFFEVDAEIKGIEEKIKGKTTKPEDLAELGETLRRLQEEKKSLLEKFNLEKIAQERVFLITEFIPRSPGSDIEGQNLKEYFKGKMSLEDIDYYLRPVLDTVAYAHDQGVAHRDLKPSNLVVTEPKDGPILKIIDFGIAKITDEGATEATTMGELAGSKIYMPPYIYSTQARKDRKKWNLVDIYCMGSILFEKITGKTPTEDLPIKTINNYLLGGQLDFDFSKIPPEIQPVLKKMLSREPDQNYQSIKTAKKELADALAQAMSKTRQIGSGVEELGASAIEQLDVDIDSEVAPAEEAAKAGRPMAKVDDGTVMARSTVLPETGPQGIGSEFLKGSREEIEADLNAIFDGEAQINYKDGNVRKAIAKLVTEIMMEHSDLSPLALDVLDMLSKYKD